MRSWRWLAGVVVLILLCYAVRQVNWTVAVAAMRHASIATLAVAILLNGASLCLRSLRWWIFLRALGIGSFRLAVRGVILGCGVNNLFVANGGEAARTVLVARAARAPSASVLATIAVERLFDPFCFGLLVVLGSFTIPLPPGLSGVRFLGVAVLLATAGMLIVLLRMHGTPRRPIPTHGWRHHVWMLRSQASGLATPRRFGAALLISTSVWLLQLAEYAVVASALGVSLPFAASVAAMIAINAGLVLRATPGGIGYFEFAYAVAVSHFGLSADVAVATALVIQMIEIIPVTIAALVVTLRMARPPQRASSLDGPLLAGAGTMISSGREP
jgi:glycosyltransferase 2 family protein